MSSGQLLLGCALLAASLVGWAGADCEKSPLESLDIQGAILIVGGKNLSGANLRYIFQALASKGGLPHTVYLPDSVGDDYGGGDDDQPMINPVPVISQVYQVNITPPVVQQNVNNYLVQYKLQPVQNVTLNDGLHVNDTIKKCGDAKSMADLTKTFQQNSPVTYQSIGLIGQTINTVYTTAKGKLNSDSTQLLGDLLDAQKKTCSNVISLINGGKNFSTQLNASLPTVVGLSTSWPMQRIFVPYITKGSYDFSTPVDPNNNYVFQQLLNSFSGLWDVKEYLNSSLINYGVGMGVQSFITQVGYNPNLLEVLTTFPSLNQALGKADLKTIQDLHNVVRLNSPALYMILQDAYWYLGGVGEMAYDSLDSSNQGIWGKIWDEILKYGGNLISLFKKQKSSTIDNLGKAFPCMSKVTSSPALKKIFSIKYSGSFNLGFKKFERFHYNEQSSFHQSGKKSDKKSDKKSGKGGDKHKSKPSGSGGSSSSSSSSSGSSSVDANGYGMQGGAFGGSFQGTVDVSA